MKSNPNHLDRKFLYNIMLAGMILLTCFGMGGLPIARVQATFSSTWYVAPSGDDTNSCLLAISPCKTIQAAINKAVSGDSVEVAAGTYMENLLMKNGINISGAEMYSTIVDADGVNKAFYALPHVNANIQMMAFTNSGIGYSGDDGNAGVVLNEANVTLTNCRSFKNPKYGILTIDGTNTITYNLIDHNLEYGIFISTDSTVVVQNNTIGSSTSDGLYIYPEAGISVTFLNNIIASNGGYGIDGEGTVSTIGVDYNDIWDNVVAIDPSITLGIGNLTLDPRFSTGGSNDYLPLASSPVINLEDPDVQYYDPVGIRNDMGAFAFNFSRIFLSLVTK
jgi:hypothetical protein